MYRYNSHNKQHSLMANRATKIICTIGPATESDEMITRLIKAGANVFRLNMSHASHEWVKNTIARIRTIAADNHAHIAILADLQGPSIRTCELNEPLSLHPGDHIEIRTENSLPTQECSISVNYDGLMSDVKVGDTMLVDNGALLFEILDIKPAHLQCRVLTEGLLDSRKHINLPGVALNLPALTEKDLADLKVALDSDIDFIAMSFVRNAAHVNELRHHITRHGCAAKIIAKIEDQQALHKLDEIIEAADGLLIARGDLGMETNLEELPIIQRQIVEKCHLKNTCCIVATHMLESMIKHPTPTRAEVSDISTAIQEQVDALTLSGETTLGIYPTECVEMLDRIAQRIEQGPSFEFSKNCPLNSDIKKITHAAITLANNTDNAALLILSPTDELARLTASLRPKQSPIYAICHHSKPAKQMALIRGVTPLVIPDTTDICTMKSTAIKSLMNLGYLHDGQALIIIEHPKINSSENTAISFIRI